MPEGFAVQFAASFAAVALLVGLAAWAKIAKPMTPLDDARALDLPAITRFVLGEMAERLTHPDRPLPFVRMVRGRHVVEHRD